MLGLLDEERKFFVISARNLKSGDNITIFHVAYIVDSFYFQSLKSPKTLLAAGHKVSCNSNWGSRDPARVAPFEQSTGPCGPRMLISATSGRKTECL